MKSTIQFRSRLAFGREILAQQATFLPVDTEGVAGDRTMYASEMQHFAGFLTVLKFRWEKLTVAQPLLSEKLR